MASRVASSLLNAMGLASTLVARTPEDYATTAVALAADAGRRGRLRADIASRREGARLFDTEGWVDGWERGLNGIMHLAMH